MPLPAPAGLTAPATPLDTQALIQFLAGLGLLDAQGHPISGARAWTPLTLINGWVAFGPGYAAPSYRKDGSGYVHLRGVTKSGTVGASIGNLPAGFRPGVVELVNHGTSAVGGNVNANGDVIPYSGAGNGGIWIEAIFLAEQ